MIDKRFRLIFCFILMFIYQECTYAMFQKEYQSPNFIYAMQFVLKHEGGLSNDKDDPGGISRYGISLRFLKETHLDINNDGVVDKNDVIQLTLTEADSVYLNDWWLKYHYNLIKNRDVAAKIFDTSVNIGASRTHIFVKKAMNNMLRSFVTVNGNLTTDEIGILNSLNKDKFIANFITLQENYYIAIVQKNPHLRVFKKGWVSRAKDLD